MLMWLVSGVALLSIAIGFLVYLKNSNSKLNRYLFAHSIFVALWIWANYFSNQNSSSDGVLIFMNSMIMVCGNLMILTLNRFIEILSGFSSSTRKNHFLYLWGAFSTVIAASPFVVYAIERQQDLVAIVFGPLAILFFIEVLFFTFRLFWLVARGIRRNTGIRRTRMQIVAIGVYGSFSILLITNVLLPFFLSSYSASVTAPLIFVVMVGVLAYLIFKHRLFNMRGAILWTVSYTLTLSAVVLAIALIIVYISGQASKTGLSLAQENTILVLLFVFGIVVFQPLHRIVEVFNSKLFYRDKYDSRDLIDQFSDVLVAEQLDEKRLIKKSMVVLNEALKASYIVFNPTVIGSKSMIIIESKSMPELMLVENTKYDPNIKVRDDSELDVIPDHGTVVGEINFDLGSKDLFMGSFIFGPKRSGRSYTSQDVDLIKVVRKNLAIAIQNARNYKEVSEFTNILKKEIKAATNDLRHTNEDLETTSIAKDEFISMAAHQIRPQLAAVRGFVD
ncbi:MAG: hypothetical protein ABL927_11680, partial [Bdellovibrionales bacterium]